MIYGWDISTSIIGYASFYDDGQFVQSQYLDLRKIEGDIAKADAAEDFVRSIDEVQDEYGVHVIEERLGNFAAGRSMLQVMMKLAAFNAVVSHLIHQVAPNSEIMRLHPSTWKALMKKEGLLIPKGADKKALTLDFVCRKQPDFKVDMNKKGNPQPWCYDMADAWCLGRSGYIKLCSGKESSQHSGGR